MARIGGRNSALAWFVGLVCAGVVVTLVVLAEPAIPMATQLVGDTLRGSAPKPAPTPTRTPDAVTTSTPECHALYSEALWSELTQRAGGDPVQDASPPAASIASLTTALAPQVRVSCTFTGTNTGRIATTVSDVAPDAADIARATLEAGGFACAAFGDGVRCEHDAADGVEEQTIRDGVWIASTFSGWHPSRYTDRMVRQVWPD
ncbi:hypothetical protein LQ938_02150 [Microbacterium sp. cx-55]|uniref:hypothetical protein n=1 Tax=Microbacterium sp. cx-55 TaxID=2875948 RepID=UPI001CBC2588|nr:hypothetical protein [Microbacterium sp. cx-55]MBZ4487608.1 hypothetical protein [Microbacterium sp. cx-55]UGB35622.1 hypothetical protein LQ938_02150 [Microbacterium sp. cx-55]